MEWTKEMQSAYDARELTKRIVGLVPRADIIKQLENAGMYDEASACRQRGEAIARDAVKTA